VDIRNLEGYLLDHFTPDNAEGRDSRACCIAKNLSAMEGFEVALTAWRVHATAFDLYQNSGGRDLGWERALLLTAELESVPVLPE